MSRNFNTRLKFIMFSAVLVALTSYVSLLGNPVWGERILLTQPDGNLIEVFIYGDEFHIRIESKEGYTLIRNEETGAIEYAVLSGGRLMPSGLAAGSVSPATLEKFRWPKHISDRRSRMAEMGQITPEESLDARYLTLHPEVRAQALTGTQKVFVVCVQFQYEESPPTGWSSGLYPPGNFDTRLFGDDPSIISMTNFYKAQSYGQFWPVGYTYPSWVRLPDTASTYKEDGSWRGIIGDAMDAIKSQDPSFDFIQHANDGEMDIILIWAGRRQTWGTFYWPKMGSVNFNKYGVHVRYYNIVNERNNTGAENTSISTFCHEYGHMIGAPDLYDYSDFQNKPMGYYCVMGSSDHRIGFCSFIKAEEYGWVDSMEIVNGGDFKIDALGLASATNPRLYRIYIDYPAEYLLLENRNNGSDPHYENYPGRQSGLLICHVDENYPPASCLPNYPFYGVEAICPNLSSLETSLYSYSAYWDEMVWGADSGFTQIGPSYPDDKPQGSYLQLVATDDTENVIYRNTRGHRNNTDIHITSIGSAGDTITFTVTKVSHTLDVGTSLGGTTIPAPGRYTFDKGRQISIEAIEDLYYSFSEWTGDFPLNQKESRIASVFMDANKSLTAHFRKIHGPMDFQGEKVLNRSLSQAEYINVLRWKSNPLNADIFIHKYRIFQWLNNRWSYITEVSASEFEYRQRFADRDRAYQFAIVAKDFRGKEGEPAYVTIH